MKSCRHLPSRREALIGSGALFAWTQMPKLARAEGRDPRMLVIVLRGALDGLGAVAPVGDPDWIGLRGDRALVLDGRTPALPLNSSSRSIRRCRTCIGSTRRDKRPSFMPRRRPIASARTSMGRMCWRAG